MPLVVREDLPVPISGKMAEDLGLHPGSPIQWERAPDGGYTLRPASTRHEAIDGLSEVLRPYLKKAGGGVEVLLEWRREDARLDGSL